jgi:hypothetical protein
MGFVEPFENSTYNDEPFIAYRLLTAGEDWLLENQDQLELRKPPRQQPLQLAQVMIDDDVPF